LLSFLPDLADIFIVSQVSLEKPGEDIPTEAYASEELPGLRVLVKTAAGEKCVRCWKFSVETSKDDQEAALCPRCSQVVSEVRA